MDFFRRNAGKMALIALIVFFTLPFIYGNEEEEDFSPFAIKPGMSYQANPISKLANRLASFYGFSRLASGNMTASPKGIDTIKGKVAGNHVFSKEDEFSPKVMTETKVGVSQPKDNVLVASSRNFKNFDVNSSELNTLNTGSYTDRKNSSNDLANKNNTTVTSSPIKGYVTINGQNYNVIEDAKGNKYVVTPKGHIPYREVMRKNISEQEFMSAKKRLAGASDKEILDALQQEKERQNYSSDINRNSSASYRNGKSVNMDNTNSVRVSTQDRGFDDEMLSKAYADLKNINLKVEGGASSTSAVRGSSSHSSFSSNDASSNPSSYQENTQTGTGLIPRNIAQTVQSQMGRQINGNEEKTPQNIKEPTEQAILDDGSKQAKEGFRETTGEINTRLGSVIVEPKSIGDNDVIIYQPISDVVTTESKIFVNENIVGDVWGQPKPVTVGEDTLEGVLLPVQFQKNKLVYTGESEQIAGNIVSMNASLNEIREALENLGSRKIFIDKSRTDLVSFNIMKEVIGEDNIVDIQEADVFLPSPVFTPNSFKIFAMEFEKQISQTGNEPA